MSVTNFSHFVSQIPFALLQVVLVWLWTLTALGLGRPFANTKGPSGISLLPGFAVLVVPALLTNMLIGLPLYSIPLACLISVAATFSLKRSLFVSVLRDNATFLYALLLMTPMMIMFALAIITGWDDISHWNPNMDYLIRSDALPRLNGPATASAWPGYPYAYPLLGYLINFLSPAYAANALPLVNVVFLSLGSSLAVYFLSGDRSRWGNAFAAVCGVLLVIPFYPGYHRSTTFVAMADYPTAISLAGIMALMISFLQKKSGTQDTTQKRGFFGTPMGELLGISLALVALVSFKQANLVHVIAIVIIMGLFLFFLRLHVTPRKAFLLMLACLPAFAMHAGWSHYVTLHINGNEFALLPFDQWRFAYVPDILQGMWDHAIVKHLHYYIMLLIVAGSGLYFLAQAWRKKAAASDLFVIASALLVLAYFSFLFFIYIANSFTLNEAKRAASFWRYGLHVGMIGWLGFLVVVRLLVQKRFPSTSFIGLRKPAVVLLFIIVAALPVVLHRQFIRETHLGERLFMRQIAAMVPPDSTVAVVDAHPGSQMPWVLSLELRSPVHHDIKGKALFHCYPNGAPTTLEESLSAAKSCNATHAVLRLTWPTEDKSPANGFQAFARQPNDTWTQFMPNPDQR